MTTSIVQAQKVKPEDIIIVRGEQYQVTQVILCRDGSVILSLDGHSPCVYFKEEIIAVVIS